MFVGIIYLLALSSVGRNTKLDQNRCEEEAGNDGVAFGGAKRDRLIVRPVLVNSPQTLSVGVAERYDVIPAITNAPVRPRRKAITSAATPQLGTNLPTPRQFQTPWLSPQSPSR